MSDKKKPTEKQKEFGRRVVEGYGPSAAYRLAFDAAKMKPEVIASRATELLADGDVVDYINERRRSREFRSDVTATMVLEQWFKLANADPGEYMQHRRGACRHCYGLAHQYQWIDAMEWATVCAVKIDEKEAPPAMDGGYGFNPLLTPHAHCPRCFGDGVGDVLVADTRNVSERSKILFAGIEQKRDGSMKILLRDQDKALENIARHLGMFNDRLPGGANGNPIAPGVNIAINAKNASEASAIYTRFMGAKNG